MIPAQPFDKTIGLSHFYPGTSRVSYMLRTLKPVHPHNREFRHENDAAKHSIY